MANFDKIEDRPTWNNMSTPKVMERMRALYETTKWHDCVFKLWKSDGSGEELIFAHNLVLASSSPVFEALCFGPMAEENPIEVPDIDPTAFKVMLKFLYTDCVEFNSVEMACNVLYASKKYLIYTLAGVAISYISCHINESNCLQIYEFASFIQEDRLIKESWSYLCSHLDDVLKYFSYESLSTDLVKNLVNEDALNGGEFIVFKICLMWAEAECENNNLEKNSENLRNVLIKADILNKIRWLTLSLEEFEEGPKKSGILTSEEIKFISRAINLLNHSSNICVDLNDQNDLKLKNSVYKLPKLRSSKGSDLEILHNILFESSHFPFSVSNIVEARKKIQLKKFYCHRFIEREVRPTIALQNELKVSTYITANKSVRLTAIFLNAKILPIPQLNTAYQHTLALQRDYKENLFINICDSNEKILFSILFYERVSYGSVFKIPLQTPVILERSKEYKIQVDFMESFENYLFGVRNSISKFPSGLCVTFKEKANIGDHGRFIDVNDLSIISGLELCL